MIDSPKCEFWFVTGSQHLYGKAALETVAANAREIAGALGRGANLPGRIVFQPVVTSASDATALCQRANADSNCAGIITWCHTFSPSKMWINGLRLLHRPIAHLHTQFNRQIPWSSIDMDFMNLNQSAHGDREHGFIMSRMRLSRKVVVGHWEDTGVRERLGAWARAAAAWHDWQGARFCRFGDNMREVAVTEGDKVSAQIQFGFSVDGYGVGDLVQRVNAVKQTEINELVAIYEKQYRVAPKLTKKGVMHSSLDEAARIELGLRAFLRDGGFKGFTTTFEDLHGLNQLPGISAQRLMADGYGFAAEGDWKTSALVRAMKVMGCGLPGGTSFMEDYTYHFNGKRSAVLGAHMLEICPSIADGKPSLEAHPLGIGGKADPVRLVFNAPPGPALNASLIDLGNRFRLIVNEVNVIRPAQPLPKLPVARALWIPKPDLSQAAAAWIYAGGAHHTGFSQAVTTEMLEDFAEMAGLELIIIDHATSVRGVKRELRWNEAYYGLGRGMTG